MISLVAMIVAMLVNVIALLVGIIRLHKIATRVERTFDYFALEHEILMQDYATRNNIKLTDLATRLRRAPWWMGEAS